MDFVSHQYYLFIAILIKYRVIAQVNFARSCNSLGRLGVAYCRDVCGPGTISSCGGGGRCSCRRTCYPDVPPGPPIQTAPNICPPMATDPPDPVLTYAMLCDIFCRTGAGPCGAGTPGRGIVCGETAPFMSVAAPGQWYAKICVCLCPANQRCPAVPTVPPNTPNLPTPTPTPNNSTNLSMQNTLPLVILGVVNKLFAIRFVLFKYLALRVIFFILSSYILSSIYLIYLYTNGILGNRISQLLNILF